MQEEQLPENVSGRPTGGGLDHVNPLAAGVLKRNGIKSWTKPAPSLYPHQWSWDSAFIALGLAHVDNRRAREELESLFAGQWATGKVPHIVFNPEAPPKSYFPDAERWNSSADRKSTRLNSSHANISYAVFCLKKKKTNTRII